MGALNINMRGSAKREEEPEEAKTESLAVNEQSLYTN